MTHPCSSTSTWPTLRSHRSGVRPAGPMTARALLDAVAALRADAEPDLDELEWEMKTFVQQTEVPTLETWCNTHGRYIRVLLTAPDDPFQVVVVFWPPGSRSPIHDHAGTSGAVMPLFGEVTETKYAVRERGGDQVALLPAGKERLRRGSFSPITAEDGDQLHAMVNDSYGWAATLHVYLHAMDEMNVYVANDEGSYRRVARKLWFDHDHGANLWDRSRPAAPRSQPEGELARSGGCACGAVRYEMDAAPVLQMSCYCDDCRKSTGSMMAPLAFYPTASLRYTKGQPKAFEHRNDSGYLTVKEFCSECGTTMVHASSSSPHLRGVIVGTLDDDTHFRPQTNVYVGSAPAWARVTATHPIDRDH